MVGEALVRLWGGGVRAALMSGQSAVVRWCGCVSGMVRACGVGARVRLKSKRVRCTREHGEHEEHVEPA